MHDSGYILIPIPVPIPGKFKCLIPIPAKIKLIPELIPIPEPESCITDLHVHRLANLKQVLIFGLVTFCPVRISV